MGNKSPIEFKKSLADSEIISFKSEKDDILIFLESWDEKIIEFKFVESIFFNIFNNWYISGVYHVDSSSGFERSLKRVYDVVPSEHPYKLIQFLDLEDDVAIEVGYKDLVISVGP